MPVGLLERARDPAPVAPVVMVPTTVPSIATLSVLFAVVPLTLTLKFVVAVPVEVDDFVTVYVTVPVAALFAGSVNVPDSEVCAWHPPVWEAVAPATDDDTR